MAFAPEPIKATLVTILNTQAHFLAAELLETARIEIVDAGSDYGVDYFSFDLRISPVKFAQIENEIEKVAKLILSKLGKMGISDESGVLNQVRIFPEHVAGAGAIAAPVPTKADETRIWNPPGRIKLFLSHVSGERVAISEIKRGLAAYGIAAFVAHEDIEPTMQWHREIEFALRSMDALCAFVTVDFIKSKWCDQEVGFALGRAVPVIAVRCGADPYGLMGKDQAMRGDLKKPGETAARIADIMAKQDYLRPRLMDGLVDSLVNANSFQDAKDSSRLVEELKAHLTGAQILQLLQAARDNSQVRDATNVPYRIGRIATARKIVLPAKKAESDFDDDIPF